MLPLFAAHLWPSPGGGLRRFLLSTATTAAIVAAPPLWFAAHGGRLELSYSANGHLFNRMVHGGGLLDREAPATRQLLEWLGDEDPRTREHMFTTWSLQDKGHRRDEIYALLGRVAWESIRAYPLTYVATSLLQAARQISSPPAMAAAGWLRAPIERIEAPPLLGVSAPALNWAETLERIQRTLWPGVVLLALLGAGWSLLRGHARELRALVWIVGAIAVTESFVEIWITRRSAMLGPAMLALATVGAALLAQRCCRRPGSGAG